VDLHETLAVAVPQLRFGIAFCEASDPRLMRASGNEPELVDLAVRNALAIGAGHSVVIIRREGYPVNVLNQAKAVPEVCRIYCATANAVQVIVAETAVGRGILGVVDGGSPLGWRWTPTSPTGWSCCGSSAIGLWREGCHP
jgi:adenosine/AMP kinase